MRIYKYYIIFIVVLCGHIRAMEGDQSILDSNVSTPGDVHPPTLLEDTENIGFEHNTTLQKTLGKTLPEFDLFQEGNQRSLQTARYSKEQLYHIGLRSVGSENDVTGVGVFILVSSAFNILLSCFTQTAPVLLGVAFDQMATANIMSLIDSFLPVQYHEFVQALSYSKLDFEFMDPTDIRMSIRRRGYINGVPFTGHTYLVPIRIPAGSATTNYIFMWMLVGVLLIVHTILIIVTCLPVVKNSDHEIWKFVKKIRSAFEFYIYFYLIVFTIPYSTITSINEVAEEYWETTLLTASFFLSIFYIIALVVIGSLPILFTFSEKLGIEDEELAHDKNWKVLLKRLRAPYWVGIREDHIARLFYTILFMKYFVLALFLVLSEKKGVQLAFFIVTDILFFAYLIIVRPFRHLLQNIVAIGNAGFSLFVAFLFIGFMKDDASGEKGLAIACSVFFGFSMLATGLAGLFFQGYLLYKKVSWDGRLPRSISKYSTQKESGEIGNTEQKVNRGSDEINNVYLANDEENLEEEA
ncbi:unnamed protein product [Moneuplotes crassus]|uniref:TRP C-terminal domain-containing protein n=1 Tax=Euplotes crassus TaxID=5936 RepID=A0AAD1UAI1_EUPCR|nr:unnamed protein product [Moneuplotes crassus]